MSMRPPEVVAHLSDHDRYRYAWQEAHNELQAHMDDLINDDPDPAAQRLIRAGIWSQLAHASATRLNEPDPVVQLTGQVTVDGS